MLYEISKLIMVNTILMVLFVVKCVVYAMVISINNTFHAFPIQSMCVFYKSVLGKLRVCYTTVYICVTVKS